MSGAEVEPVQLSLLLLVVVRGGGEGGDVDEAAQVHLMSDPDSGCRPEAVLGDNQVDLTAAGMVALPQVGPLDQDHQIGDMGDSA